MATSDSVGMIKIPLTEQGDTIIVQQSGAEPLGVILTLHDSRGKGTSNVDASPAECDALIAAIGRALGRPPGGDAARPYVPSRDLLLSEPLCAALAAQGATQEQALEAITGAMRSWKDRALALKLLDPSVIADVDKSIEAIIVGNMENQ